MAVTFTKLFSSITTSTIWREDDHTRLVWITMLAMADKHGQVISSVPGLAHVANVDMDRTLIALEKLAGPDKWSNTQEHEGRRIEKIDRGWRLLNYVKFRQLRDEEERRYYKTVKQREYRAKSKKVDKTVDNEAQSGHNADADADRTPPTPPQKSRGGRKRAIPTHARILIRCQDCGDCGTNLDGIACHCEEGQKALVAQGVMRKVNGK